jgi:hypothetical protein
MVRGQDDRNLESGHTRKTYSAEVNWGVRFDPGDTKNVKKFLQDIAAYVAEQLNGLQVQARGVGISVKQKQKGAKEPYKHLGHGPCDNYSRTKSLGWSTSDAVQLGQVAWDLYEQLHIPPEELRGFGIQCSKLEPVSMFVSSDGSTVTTRGEGRDRTTELTNFFKPVASNPSTTKVVDSDCVDSVKDPFSSGVDDNRATGANDLIENERSASAEEDSSITSTSGASRIGHAYDDILEEFDDEGSQDQDLDLDSNWNTAAGDNFNLPPRLSNELEPDARPQSSDSAAEGPLRLSQVDPQVSGPRYCCPFITTLRRSLVVNR